MRPWKLPSPLMNYKSKNKYRGTNLFLLWMEAGIERKKERRIFNIRVSS